MLGGGQRLAGMDLGAEPRNRPLHLLPPLLLLQDLLHLNSMHEEELEGGVVHDSATGAASLPTVTALPMRLHNLLKRRRPHTHCPSVPVGLRTRLGLPSSLSSGGKVPEE